LQRFCQKCGCDTARVRRRWWGRAARSSADEPPLHRAARRCNRLQPLADFEGAKHTCASALATHNARRRRRKPDTPPSDTANGSGEREAAPGLSAVSAWLSEFAEHSSAPSANKRALLLMCVSSTEAAPAVPPDCTTALAAAAAAAVQAAALHGCTLHIKLPSAAGPDDVPLSGLQDAAADVLRAAVAPPTVAVRPGCVLLALDALLPAAAARGVSAERVAAAVAGCFEPAVSVLWDGAAPPHATTGSLRASPPPPRLWPAAVHAGSAGGEWTSLRVDDGDVSGQQREGCTWHARLAGRTLAVETAPAMAGTLRLRLPAGSDEGAVLLEQQWPDGGVSRPRVLLLCADARVVAQVAAAAERAAGDSCEADAATQAATRLLGDALRPTAPRRVRAAAAVAAARMGWDAALTRLLHDAARAEGAALLQALLLAAAPHAQQGPCSGVLVLRAGGAWPAGACERAAAALHAASSDDAHLRPDCAVAAALAREADPAAAAVLASVAQVLHDRDEDDDCGDEGADNDYSKGGAAMQPRGRVEEVASLAADAEEEERAYVAFLERRNGTHMRAISALALLGNSMCMLNMARYALLAPGPPANLSHMGTFAGAVSGTYLHPLQGGPPRSPMDVPWPVFVSHVRVFFWASLLLRTPLQVAWVAAAARYGRATAPTRPTPPTSYESVFLGFLLADTVFYALAEALAMHAGFAVEWPTVNALLCVVGLAIGLRNGPFRARAVRIFCVAKLAATAVPLLYARAWRVLFLHATVALQLAVLLLGLACANVRERALRKAAAAERDERAAKAKAKQ